MHKFLKFFLEWNSTCFGQFLCLKHVEFHSKNKFEKFVHLVGFIIGEIRTTFTSYLSDTVSIVRHSVQFQLWRYTNWWSLV